jgi:hypothetical protein
LNKEIQENVQIRMLQKEKTQDEDEEEEAQTPGDGSEESQERRAEEWLDHDEIVRSRMHKQGIRDPIVIAQAIEREKEIRKMQYELRVRDEEFKREKQQREKQMQERIDEMRRQEEEAIYQSRRQQEEEQATRMRRLEESRCEDHAEQQKKELIEGNDLTRDQTKATSQVEEDIRLIEL